MKIVRCDESYRDAWNAFVEARASFYHRFEWRHVNRQALGHRSCYLAAVDGDRIAGILPLVHVTSRLFGNVACSLPFVNYGGPCVETPAVERHLLREASAVADEWGVDYVEIRSTRHLGTHFPTSEHKVSLWIDLSQGIDALWKGFTHSHRQDIRRGYGNDFIVKHGGVELLHDFYVVLSDAWRAMGTPIYSKRYFEAVAKTFPSLVRLSVVYSPEKPAAASFQALDRGVGEGLWLGSRSQYRSQYAGYVLYWELLKDAAAHGCTRFHLGRSTAHSNAETYKKKWNAETTQLFWQYLLRTRQDIPQVNVSNPKYRTAIAMWRRLPVAVTNMVGPMLARSIP